MRTRSFTRSTSSIDSHIQNAIRSVRSGSNASYSFPPSLTSSDRHLVHKAAASAGLMHFTNSQTGQDKFITIAQPHGETAVRNNYNLRASNRNRK